MEDPFPIEDAIEAISQDIGLRQFIERLPPEQAGIQRQQFLNPEALKHYLGALTEADHQAMQQMLPGIQTLPKEAVRLYDEHRYLEAREKLLQTLALYDSGGTKGETGVGDLTAFVAQRVKAGCCRLLADTEWALGHARETARYHEQALELAKQTGDSETMALALLGLGTCCARLHELDRGIGACEEGLQRIRDRQDLWEMEIRLLTTLSVLYTEKGDGQTAIDHALGAVDRCFEKGDPGPLCLCLNNLACIYAGQQDLDTAHDALKDALDAARQAEDRETEVTVLNNMAMVLLKRSADDQDLNRAEECIEEALSLAEDLGHIPLQGQTLNSRGFLYQLRGRDEEAGASVRQAIDLFQRLGARGYEAEARMNLARQLYDRRGDLEGARVACSRAIDLIEGIRGGLSKEADRISYSEEKTDPYETMIEILWDLGRPHEAVEVVERAKSRALLDFLESRVVEEIAVPSGSATFHEALALLEEMDEIRANLETLSRGKNNGQGSRARGGNGQPEEIQVHDLAQQLAAREGEFDRLYAQLLTLDPETASLVRPSGCTVPEIQGMLDPETLFLDMYQAPDRLYLFPLTRGGALSPVSVELPLEEAFAQIQDLLSHMRDKMALDADSHDFIRRVRQPLADLFERIIRPLGSALTDCRRLLAAPHLFWHYFPFQALYNRKEKRYLVDQLEIGYCPSAGVLGLCRRKDRTARETALILARNNGDLPYVEREADLLRAAFDPNGRVFKGPDAHLGRLKGAPGQQDVIHLACHGHFQSDRPFLSGLDLPADGDGERQTYLLDFYGLHMPCTLTTLSACDSALSGFTRADELIGLSRGLFYAGAASVLLSLWQVSDESTCYLMENFYWHYVKNRQTKTRALQLAMQAVKARREWVHPFFWAPFVVMGDWR